MPNFECRMPNGMKWVESLAPKTPTFEGKFCFNRSPSITRIPPAVAALLPALHSSLEEIKQRHFHRPIGRPLMIADAKLLTDSPRLVHMRPELLQIISTGG